MKHIKLAVVCALTAGVLLAWGQGSLAQVDVDQFLSADEPMMDVQDDEMMGMMDDDVLSDRLDMDVLYEGEDGSPEQEEPPERRAKRSEMREKMRLSDDQKDRMEALRTAFAKEMARLRADVEIASIELRESMTQISPKAVEVQVKAARVSQTRARVFERMIGLRVDSKNVMTPEQQKIMKDQSRMRRPMRGGPMMQGRRGGMRGMGPMMQRGMGPMRRRMNPMGPAPMMPMDGRGLRQEFLKRIAPPDAPETPAR